MLKLDIANANDLRDDEIKRFIHLKYPDIVSMYMSNTILDASLAIAKRRCCVDNSAIEATIANTVTPLLVPAYDPATGLQPLNCTPYGYYHGGSLIPQQHIQPVVNKKKQPKSKGVHVDVLIEYTYMIVKTFSDALKVMKDMDDDTMNTMLSLFRLSCISGNPKEVPLPTLLDLILKNERLNKNNSTDETNNKEEEKC